MRPRLLNHADEPIKNPDDIQEAEVHVVKSVSKADRIESMVGGSQSGKSAEETLWEGTSTVVPIYNPWGLVDLYRNSGSIRPNVDAMAANIDGFGWHAEPVLDFDDEGIREQVAVSIYLDKYSEWERSGGTKPSIPKDDEITERLNEWRQEASLEKARMLLHFTGSCYESSFVDLRKQTTTDKEVIGYAGWEIIRASSDGPPQRYIHVDSSTLRYADKVDEVPVLEWQWTSPVTYRQIPVKRRFRLIVQIDGSGIGKQYFREFGDPRVVSSKTGEIYKSVAELEADEQDVDGGGVPANEILIFSIYFPGSTYGIPRYHGAISEARGQVIAANENVDDLENGSIPRGILAVMEGKVGKKGAENLTQAFMAGQGKVRNRMAIINAQTPRARQFMPGSAGVKIEFIDLTGAQRQDAMFLEYDQRAELKIGRQFRQPPIVRGDTKDYNKATGSEALRYTEEQVYQPERNTFDWIINRRILPLLGIRFWRFRSRGPVRHDPDTSAKLAEILLKQGVVVPAELRPWAERMLGIDLVRIAGDWQQLPIGLTAQGWKPESKPSLSEAQDGQLPDGPKDLDAEPPEDEQQSDMGVLKSEAKALVELAKSLNNDDFGEVLSRFKASRVRDRDAIDRMFGR